jgi:hypothetical protein
LTNLLLSSVSINGGYKNYTESICPVGQTNFTQFINRFGLTMPNRARIPG